MNLKNTNKLYQFNFCGKLIKEFQDINEAVEYLDKSRGNIFCIVRRKSIVNQEYYLSFNLDFKPIKKRANFNPLFSKSNKSLH